MRTSTQQQGSTESGKAENPPARVVEWTSEPQGERCLLISLCRVCRRYPGKAHYVMSTRGSWICIQLQIGVVPRAMIARPLLGMGVFYFQTEE